VYVIQPANVLLFSHIRKFFLKKNQKSAFLHDLFGIFAHYACIKWGNFKLAARVRHLCVLSMRSVASMPRVFMRGVFFFVL
jgi:hypothetical protein